jgi:hypothetical protein
VWLPNTRLVLWPRLLINALTVHVDFQVANYATTRANAIQSVYTSALIDTNPVLVEIWECRRLQFLNLACVETQFPNSDLSRLVPYRVASALASITAEFRAAAT